MQSTDCHHILLVCKNRHKDAIALGRAAEEWLCRKGHIVTRITAGEDSPAYAETAFDFAVVLGGDGTMLGVARRLVGRNIPLLGINFGRVGFLTNAQPEQWQASLESCLRAQMPVQHCMALQWSLLRRGAAVATGYAVNDVVLGRGSLARLVTLEVFVDECRLRVLRGDGLVFSTPVGTSGYCVSAGGPLVYSTLETIAFTPLCPFLAGTPPMIFPGGAAFRVRLLQGAADCCLTIDGQEGLPLERDDTVFVTGAPAAVSFFSDTACFFAKLRSRGFFAPPAPDHSAGDKQ